MLFSLQTPQNLFLPLLQPIQCLLIVSSNGANSAEIGEEERRDVQYRRPPLPLLCRQSPSVAASIGRSHLFPLPLPSQHWTLPPSLAPFLKAGGRRTPHIDFFRVTGHVRENDLCVSTLVRQAFRKKKEREKKGILSYPAARDRDPIRRKIGFIYFAGGRKEGAFSARGKKYERQQAIGFLSPQAAQKENPLCESNVSLNIGCNARAWGKKRGGKAGPSCFPSEHLSLVLAAQRHKVDKIKLHETMNC